MSVILFPNFTAAPNIPLNDDIESDGINDIKTPIEAFLEAVADFSESSWDATNNGNNISIDSVINNLDATAGDFSLTLPPISSLDNTFKYCYTFKNLTSNGNQPTISTFGTDTIQRPNELLAVPTSTSYIFNIFNEVVSFVPNFGDSTWGILYRYANFGRYRAKVYKSVSQNLTASVPTTVTFPDELYDYNNNFSTSTNIYTVPFDGNLQVSGTLGNFATADRTVNMRVIINSVNKLEVATDFVQANKIVQKTFSGRFKVQKGDEVKIEMLTDVNSFIRQAEEVSNIAFDMIDDMY